jgi:hypothetical protein
VCTFPSPLVSSQNPETAEAKNKLLKIFIFRQDETKKYDSKASRVLVIAHISALWRQPQHGIATLTDVLSHFILESV